MDAENSGNDLIFPAESARNIELVEIERNANKKDTGD